MGYEYGYEYGYESSGLGVVFGVLIFIWIIAVAVGIFSLVCNWKVYKKAGKQGWEAIIPIYNIIVLLEITNLPMWYLVLFLVPIGNVVALFLIYIELAKKFGQSAGFGIGLVFLNPIFMAILAFNKNYVYQFAPVGQFYNNQSMNNQQNFGPQPQQFNGQNFGPQPQQFNGQLVSNGFCSNCGAPLTQGDKFCINCGKQL